MRRTRYDLEPDGRMHLTHRCPIHIDHGRVVAADNQQCWNCDVPKDLVCEIRAPAP
jgi:hypothetical protein